MLDSFFDIQDNPNGGSGHRIERMPKERPIAGNRGAFRAVLADPRRPRPIFLVEGAADAEIGAHLEVRERSRLALLNAADFPRNPGFLPAGLTGRRQKRILPR
jgi:hypothetical protein